jgi:hypothetical protein
MHLDNETLDVLAVLCPRLQFEDGSVLENPFVCFVSATEGKPRRLLYNGQVGWRCFRTPAETEFETLKAAVFAGGVGYRNGWFVRDPLRFFILE